MTNSNDASGPSSSSSTPKSPRSSSGKGRKGRIAAQNKERLSTALSLAQEAVQLDTENCEEAIEAYTTCLKLIDEVDCSMTSHREELIASGQSDSREIKTIEMTLERLDNITRTYADRLRMLCDAYNIDPVTMLRKEPRKEEEDHAHAVFDALAAYKSVYPVRVKSKL